MILLIRAVPILAMTMGMMFDDELDGGESDGYGGFDGDGGGAGVRRYRR